MQSKLEMVTFFTESAVLKKKVWAWDLASAVKQQKRRIVSLPNLIMIYIKY